MKIIHTSDWHLGQTLYGHDRTEEQTAFLNQLVEIVRKEQPDALVVSGDIFHTSTPSSTIQKLYTEHLLRIRQAAPTSTIVVTAGNHDSASKLEITSSLWQHFGVYIIGQIHRNTDGTTDLSHHIIPVRPTPESAPKGFIIAVPHVYPYNFPDLTGDTPREQRQEAFFKTLQTITDQLNSDNLPVVLMAHLTVTGSDQTGHDLSLGGMDSIDIRTLGNGYDYLALGHIHGQQTLSSPCGTARYCGTPIPVSFDEKGIHSVSLVEITAHHTHPKIQTIPIQNPCPLHTLPTTPLPIEEALEALRNFSTTDTAYIRLNVLAENFLNPNAQEQASELSRQKGYRFCYIHIQRPESKLQNQHHALTVQELRKKSPVDIARMYYEDTQNTNLPEDFTTMIQEAWHQIQEENN